MKTRRPSLIGEGLPSRRNTSDAVPIPVNGLPPPTVPTRMHSETAITTHPTTRATRPLPPSLPVPPLPSSPSAAETAQVVQVLTNAAHRVAHQSQVVAASQSPATGSGQLQALARQQQVLTLTAVALENEVLHRPHLHADPASTSSSVLVATAQQVVNGVARQVAADRSAFALQQMTTAPSAPPPRPVSLNDVSVATQSAVAQAVALTDPRSSEVEVMMTANALVQNHTRVNPLMPLAPVVEAPAPVAVIPPQPLPIPLSMTLGPNGEPVPAFLGAVGMAPSDPHLL
ncbi:hypothetical protein BOTBODRAFT_546041 [Botryobasidium botryosum FD-172 SS1]|uniref:Uncharacterized protein n=1 Tax=Botryobasidium botryosum (strain FD-172 SS1) TaxID=930990 RepID=A0A067MQZ1_BOTB1|nr:hypothetical protein BOTBODRAFT_546041 [Botryobasidium botryosum FD-172 SS1]